MATFTDKALIDELIANDGHYEDDPRVLKIVEYNNQFNGGLAWGVVYEMETHPDAYNRYEMSGACHNPRVIWEAGNGPSRSA